MLLVASAPSVVDVGEHLARSRGRASGWSGVCVATADPSWGSAGELVPVVGTPGDVRAARGACGADAVAITTESRPGELTALVGELVGRPASSCWWPRPSPTWRGPRTVVRDVAGLPLLHVAEPTFTGPSGWRRRRSTASARRWRLLVLAPVFR